MIQTLYNNSYYIVFAALNLSPLQGEIVIVACFPGVNTWVKPRAESWFPFGERTLGAFILALMPAEALGCSVRPFHCQELPS